VPCSSGGHPAPTQLEEAYGERPPFGVVVLGDGLRVEVENTEALRLEVLAIAEKIRERRRAIGEEIPVQQPAWKCRICGQREIGWLRFAA
jgi:CRISPR-associated exonuclease Cas4